MSYRNKRFNQQFLSLEKMLAGYKDVSKASVLSDRGRSAARMVEEIEGREKVGEESRWTADEDSSREEALFEAEMRLVEAGKSHLIRVLLLIVENGSNREESVAKMPRRTYFLHRSQLLDFFC